MEREEKERTEMKEREKCRTGAERVVTQNADARSDKLLQGFWNILDYFDVEMYISSNFYSFQRVYIVNCVSDIVPSTLHILTHLINFHGVSQFLDL